MIGSEREYIKLGRVETERVNTPGESYVKMTDLFGCPDCGAVVFDTHKHDLSHTTSIIGLGI